MGLTKLFSIFAVTACLLCAVAFAQQESILLNFDGTIEGGRNPMQGLIFDAHGNLYGTTSLNGTSGQGIVFEMSLQADGIWKEKHLYNLQNGHFSSNGSCLIVDSEGNLYTVTGEGGAYRSGTVLKLSPDSSGSWSAKVLHTFDRNDGDGVNPGGCLTFDGDGNLYGATLGGGTHGYGTAFELTPTKAGAWREIILHNFNSTPSEGGFPTGGLVFDSSGNLYGTTRGGTLSSYGSVFELSPRKVGKWAETILHTFVNGGDDGVYPYAGVVIDSAGNLYGTTNQGGANGGGPVFEVSQAINGDWAETVLYSFGSVRTDGTNPAAGLVIDRKGDLYGTTLGGGRHGGGTVFQMTYSSDAGWEARLLDSFGGVGGGGRSH